MVKDTTYYDLLAVQVDASEIEIKKKAALSCHPDRNKTAEAEVQFRKLSQAAEVLSDAHSRAHYDKYGLTTGSADDMDPAAVFQKMFGGEAFEDIIGQIALVKDLTESMEVQMTEEEKEKYEMEKMEYANGMPSGSTSATKHITQGESSTTVAASDKTKNKLTPEQRAKMETLRKAREAEREKRIVTLVEKLKLRTKAYLTLDAKDPAGVRDFEQNLLKQIEDLKMASFGIELLHTVGSVYVSKGGAYIKSRRSNFLSNWYRGIKSKGGVIKDTVDLVWTLTSVHAAMSDISKQQDKGVDEERKKELEQEMMSKMLAAGWKGTRWEVNGVIREVCDRFLAEAGVSEGDLYKRAQALVVIGTLWKAVEPDENDQERRELERLVMSANNKKAAKKPNGTKTPVL